MSPKILIHTENSLRIVNDEMETVDIPFIHTNRKTLAEQNSCFQCNKVIPDFGNVYIDNYGIFYCTQACLIYSRNRNEYQ